MAVSLLGDQEPLARAQTFTVLHKFNRAGDGGRPLAGVIRDAKGNLYGTTFFGGSFGYGSVFEVRRDGKEIVLHSFTGGDGMWPAAPLVRDAAGNLYGTTTEGGTSEGGRCTYGCGTVFKVDKHGNASILHSFNERDDGAIPSGPVILDSAGNLYGTTNWGGTGCYTSGCGIVFRISASGKETIFYSFMGGNDGASPSGGLVRDTEGNFYGVTSQGGAVPPYGYGTIYKISKEGHETVLYSLNGKGDGANPLDGVLLDEAGNLYGTARSGGGSICGSGCGTVFELNASGKFTVLHTFRGGTGGGNPESGVVRDRAGNLYGSTFQGGDVNCASGGSYGCGLLFKLEPGGQFTVLHNFSGNTDGIFPNGLWLDSADNLYGTTPEFNIFSHHIIGAGEIFKLIP